MLDESQIAILTTVSTCPSTADMVARPTYPNPASGWQPYQAIITRLYSKENRTLKEVMLVMEYEYGFKAT